MTAATANYAERSNRMLTFLLGDTRFAIDISSILSITDDFEKLEKSSNHQESFLGYLYYRNKPVNTFEISTLLGRQSNRHLLGQTITDLQKAEADHIQWVQTLENALRNDTNFTLPRKASQCEFDSWLSEQKKVADDVTRNLLERFSGPHHEFHALADKLLKLKESNGLDAALKELRTHKRGLINEAARLFKYAQEQLKSSVHPVVLYITRDGVTPWFALILDSMDDIAEYADDQFTQLRGYDFDAAEQQTNDPVYGYIHNPDSDEKDCLILSASRLAQLIDH
jgi:chemotaxis signal transduction protein